MASEPSVAEITAQLDGASIVDRRAGVAGAAQFLADPACTPQQRAELIEVLHDFVATERFPTARGDAQIILDNVWTGLAADTSADDRRHMIGVKCCPCGHVSYFDKRRLCGDQTIQWRSRMRAPDRSDDEYYVDCQGRGCNNVIKIELDCGEYAP